jgi:hypothetical protein
VEEEKTGYPSSGKLNWVKRFSILDMRWNYLGSF